MLGFALLLIVLHSFSGVYKSGVGPLNSRTASVFLEDATRHEPGPAAASVPAGPHMATADAHFPSEGDACHQSRGRVSGLSASSPAPGSVAVTPARAEPARNMTGGGTIRGPSHDGACAVDLNRLQIQRA